MPYNRRYRFNKLGHRKSKGLFYCTFCNRNHLGGVRYLRQGGYICVLGALEEAYIIKALEKLEL